MDFYFSDSYAEFIMPSVSKLQEEAYISDLSETEKELYLIKLDMLNGKILRMDNEEYDLRHSSYEDVIGFVLFCAEESGKITEEESYRLYKKYTS